MLPIDEKFLNTKRSSEMNYKILNRDSEYLLDNDDFLNEFSDYAGQPAEESKFYLNAALEIIEQSLDISLVPNTIEVSIPCKSHTVTLPLRKACSIISASVHGDCGYEKEVHPLNTRLVSGRLFLPRNDWSWLITYETEPYQMDASTKLATFKLADSIINGDIMEPHHIKKMLKQYDVTVGSVPIPH